MRLPVVLAALLLGGAASSAATLSLHIGAGGQLTSLDVKCDGNCSGGSGTATKVVRGHDGAWYYNPALPNCGNAKRVGCWQQLVTPSSFPSAAVTYGKGERRRRRL